MFRLTIKELLAKKLRLLTTALAVMLGVAFMAGTLVLTDTMNRTFDGLLSDAYAGTDAYVRGVSELDAGTAQAPRLDAVRRRRRRQRPAVSGHAVRVHHRLRPARRPPRQGRRQPRPGCPGARARRGSPTTSSTRTSSPRAAPRRHAARSSSTGTPPTPPTSPSARRCRC